MKLQKLIFILTGLTLVSFSSFATGNNEITDAAQGSTISGFIKDASDGEILIGAS